MNDLRAAWRQLSKSPGFAAIAILTLALCIGANSAIFSVVRAILLKPYPWPQSEQLVYLYNSYPRSNLDNAGDAIPDYLDRRAGVSGLEDSALYHRQSVNLGTDGEPERLSAVVGTPSLFSTLRSGAQLGRTFAEDDALPGAAPTAVLSYSCWKNHFGADPKIIGRTIRLDSWPVTVVGVMPEGFFFPAPSIQLWLPFVFKPEERTDDERGNEYSMIVGRLRPGATLPSIQRELDLVQAHNAQRLPNEAVFWANSGFGGKVKGFLEQNVGEVRSMLWLIQAGVAAALLIGCANVASLLLARALARERELAVRAALGASRWRLIRMLLTESLVLFVLGGLGGLLAAEWGIGALGAVGLSALPRAYGVTLDLPVFLFTLGSALATGLVFGVLPAWMASKGDAAAALKEAGTRGGTAGSRTQFLRSALVVGEIALAIMLLSTASLLVKSFERMQREEPGFRPDGLLTAQLTLPHTKYDSAAKLQAFHDAVLERLQHAPGVTAAAFTDILPFSEMNSSASYTSPDIVLPPNASDPHAQIRSADPEFLATFGVTLLEGRWFTAADVAKGHPVAVIDRLLAQRYWPGRSALGKRIASVHGDEVAEIVGVVSPVKVRGLDENVTKETIYFPYAQAAQRNLAVLVRSGGEAAALTNTLRAAVHDVDPEQPVYDVHLMRERMELAAQPRRAPMLLLGLFSAVALLLAMLGVYGVLSFAVARRTPEFGVRVALGATPGNIASLVLRQAGVLVAVGIAVGLGGYFAVSHLVSSLLFGITASDPLALSVAPFVLAVVAAGAALLPARRATRIDPMIALRSE